MHGGMFLWRHKHTQNGNKKKNKELVADLSLVLPTFLSQGLGMREEFGSDGGKRILVSQPFIEGLDDMEEETDGLACMVCREGYSLRPNDILGVYSFAKRVNLGTGAHASGSGAGTGLTRGDCVYTTVSHFNIIHFQCHQEAKRADAALKNPKKEWEGAALRNNETLCNCIFPLRGPAVPLVQYARCVDQYWDNLSALGRADGSRLRLLTYDIVLVYNHYIFFLVHYILQLCFCKAPKICIVYKGRT
jgi:E3 ubiquitin-protein ligase UBR4